MSLVDQDKTTTITNSVANLNERPPIRLRKVLEEDEYLGRMAKIIKRDFFNDLDHKDFTDTPTTTIIDSERSNQMYNETPGTDRTNLSSTSSHKALHREPSTRLNEFLDNYTSEDNAYFDKLQRKDLRKHRAKFPWLYTDRSNHNKQVCNQLQLTSGSQDRSSLGQQSAVKMIDWHYNPQNSLFYPPDDKNAHRTQQSTVNYESNKYGNVPIFKEPLPVRTNAHIRSHNRFTDKIGIDGKLLDGSETPTVNGYSYVPPPDSPQIVESFKVKRSTNHYFIPSESPRDVLAHRLYEDKVAKKIRTPRSSTRSDSTKTPKSRLDKIF